MNVDVGDIIEIGGKTAIVCFETNYNDENYICVAFENNVVEYDIYKWRFQNDRFQVAKVINEEELSNVLKVFLDESVRESDSPDELKGLFAKIFERFKESNGAHGEV